MSKEIENLISSRKTVNRSIPQKIESEGGCGVIGVACAEKIAGKHLIMPLLQMKNRGNGKGGGIAAAGFFPEEFGVTQTILDQDYLIAIAYLDLDCKVELEQKFIYPLFNIDHIHTLASLPGFPKAVIYFARVKQEAADSFRQNYQLAMLAQEAVEDELVYQNSYKLNQHFYAAAGEKKAFVLSHGKNLLVLKCIGFADDVIKGYQIENLEAHIWIGHHRYPTKGKIWHPGGAHPFVGLHEALVHNGDFANYYSICEYLIQRHIQPLFLTDTEVAALLFDLLHRTYRYPLEYVMEAFAPTTEKDFYNLPVEKQHLYTLIQKTHLNASPDGPWFFIIAQSQFKNFRLIGITDTSMLRPQVFSMQLGPVPIGIIGSEKQAIDALLMSLSAEKKTVWPRADYYWSTRGGSYTDGGAFVFNIAQQEDGKTVFTCQDKFGQPFANPMLQSPGIWQNTFAPSEFIFPDSAPAELFEWAKTEALSWDYSKAEAFLHTLLKSATSEENDERALYVLTKLLNQVYPLHIMRRSFFLALVEHAVSKLIEMKSKISIRKIVYLDGNHLPVDGEHSMARVLVNKYKAGFKKFILGNCRGHRFIANGLGPASNGVEIDVYGSPGDYLASGIDGACIRVHNNAQDQIAQIMKEGKLIIYGDVGQTFLYGAKGGVAFVRGSTAGRCLINAVGGAKLIINGTSLDYFAESFMAGDPLKGGGFAIINRIAFDEEGNIIELNPPYPGNNLFSLASGGAIYIRDPEKQLSEDQLNGGKFTELTTLDQNLIVPYLEENALLFNIPISRLLQMGEKKLTFQEVYRKIIPSPNHLMNPEEVWVKTGRRRWQRTGHA